MQHLATHTCQYYKTIKLRDHKTAWRCKRKLHYIRAMHIEMQVQRRPGGSTVIASVTQGERTAP